MENASKALLIAGGVLIAIMVATFGIYFAQKIADHSSDVYAQLEQHNIDEFNQQFLNYNNQNITLQDIATIINLARDSNMNNEFYDINVSNVPNDNSLYVTVNINGISIYQNDGSTKTITNPHAEIIDDSKPETDIATFLSNTVSQQIYGTGGDLELSKFPCKVQINQGTGYVNYIQIGN